MPTQSYSRGYPLGTRSRFPLIARYGLVTVRAWEMDNHAGLWQSPASYTVAVAGKRVDEFYAVGPDAIPNARRRACELARELSRRAASGKGAQANG